ncbi:Cyclase-associated protein 1 [Diplonema papillatum]|nr:Cyclase-associated protein 1 [Diplonema papillatum]
MNCCSAPADDGKKKKEGSPRAPPPGSKPPGRGSPSTSPKVSPRMEAALKGGNTEQPKKADPPAPPVTKETPAPPKAEEANMAAKPAPKGGAPPPPPPPPPPAGFMENLMKKSGQGKNDGSAARAALFADIAKGTDITKGLRKVSDSDKRHKNRAEGEVGKATDFAELERKKAARQEELEKKKRAGYSSAAVKEPKLALEGKLWKIENQLGTKLDRKNDVLKDCDMKQSIALDGCENYVLEVENKINMISISNCKNVGIMVKNDVVASIEVSRGEKIEVLAGGKLPSFILDRSNEVMLYTNEKSRDVEITSCACTCVNVTFSDETGGPDADPIERPVPEQFVTRIVTGADGHPKLETGPMEHAG